jgi:hypothetical protein
VERDKRGCAGVVMKRAFRSIIILTIGVFVCHRIIITIDDWVVFDPVINLILIVCALIVYLIVLWIDYRDYNKTDEKLSFFPSISGLFLCFGLVGILYFLNKRDISPVKLSCATKIVDFNGVFIDFREDGTYKLTNGCVFGETIYRGKYIIKDSIITLDKDKIDLVIVSNKLLITADGIKDSLGNIEKSIYQINNYGIVIRDAIDFRVTSYYLQ